MTIAILSILLIYFIVLFIISRVTSRKATNDSFFRAGRSAPWYLVAFGMVGTSLSGATFVSVPGFVGQTHFYYFQVVIGFFLGYFVVAFVLLPLYYRLNLTSIYDYLQQRFDMISYKTGALFFIISRTLGATLRLYIVINTLQACVLDDIGVPFHVTTVVIIGMILLYTFKGGVKTIVWTDTLQTFFMLLALVVCVIVIMNKMDLGAGAAWSSMKDAGHTALINNNWRDKSFFLKHIIGGIFITISMTGLDQEMMQKNISVRTLKDSQKNMISFSFILVAVNFVFLVLGGMLYLYATSEGAEWTTVLENGKQATKFLIDHNGVTTDIIGDKLFPHMAMEHLPDIISIIFIVGLISALFPSADGAITALTASSCIDILGINRNKALSEEQRITKRKTVHLAFAFIALLLVIMFKVIDSKTIVDTLFIIAGYTYGPLLGLFAFGILTKRKIAGYAAPVVCLVAPCIAFVFDYFSQVLFNGYQFGYEMIIFNGALTFAGLWLISHKAPSTVEVQRGAHLNGSDVHH